MIVACGGCEYRFEPAGYRDAQCPVCGELTPIARACPACERPLVTRRISDATVDECSGCGGVFLDTQLLEHVLADRRHPRIEALLAALPGGGAQPLPAGEERPVRGCPTCKTAMAHTLAYGSGALLDVCRLHGTFLPAGMLHGLVGFAEPELRRRVGPAGGAASASHERSRDDDREVAAEVVVKVVVCIGVIGWLLIKMFAGG